MCATKDSSDSEYPVYRKMQEKMNYDLPESRMYSNIRESRGENYNA